MIKQLDEQFDIVNIFIEEAGQETGEVSGAMARQALSLIHAAYLEEVRSQILNRTIEDIQAAIDYAEPNCRSRSWIAELPGISSDRKDGES